MVKISIAIATYNEEKNLVKCLDSIEGFANEIVVVDGGSSDETVEVAKKYEAKIIKADNPIIFHINKQKAVEACTYPWILQLDADEIVSEKLKKEILDKIRDQKNSCSGYYIPRKNYFLGKWMKKGGLYPDCVIRLFKNGKGRFPCRTVHEQIEIDGKVDYLINELIHNAYPNFKSYLKKADTYTSLTAYLMKKQRLRVNFYTFLNYFFIKPIKAFFTLFIRHQGFMDGYLGLVWAFFSGLHFPMAYLKFWEQQKQKS